MTNQKSAERAELGSGSFHDPTALVLPNLTPIVVTLPLLVIPIGPNQLDIPPLQPLAKRGGVVSSVGDSGQRLLSRSASKAQEADVLELRFRNPNLCRKDTVQPSSQWKSQTVNRLHTLRLLDVLSFTGRIAYSLVDAKLLPSYESSHFSRLSESRVAKRRALQIQPHNFILPLPYLLPAGHRREKLLGKKPLRGSGLQTRQYALKRTPIPSTWSILIVLSALRLRQRRFYQIPMLTCAQPPPLLLNRT